jgi:hypothetical protein
MKKLAGVAIATALASYGFVPLLGAADSAQAQTCRPLAVVNGQGTTVEKKISPPGSPLPYGQAFRNNWNTDFVVNNRAQRYIAKIVAINGGKYRVAMHLKYPNNTSDKVYEQTLTLTDGKAVTISGSPRTDQTPYQVNILVGGVPVVGNSYRASVAACN